MSTQPSTRRAHLRKLILSLLMPLWLGGCYYGQAIKGHLSLMGKRQDAQSIIEDESRDPQLRQRLQTALDARRFASSELGLPDNKSYTHYADLKGQPPVWMVVAAPALSLDPRIWCYPFAGCVSYRGYFKQDAALRHARKLETDEGMDTAVTAAAAYSTLGWFADPLLSNMLNYPDAELAGLIFHELAHQHIYVKGNTTFNESFATAVERIGVARWLEHRNQPEALAQWEARGERRRQFNQLLLDTRSDLLAIYAGDQADNVKAQQKQRRLDRLKEDYETLKLSWDNDSRYDGYFDPAPNNANFALLATYEGAVPAFMQLYEDSKQDLPTFFARTQDLASGSEEARRSWLDSMTEKPTDGL